jgi:ribonucleoside-diphosphate reductase alpha chain
MIAAARERLPNRRASTTFAFACGPHRYTATVDYFPGTNKLAEIFLSNGRAGSDIDAAAIDSGVVASIALQHGIPVDVIRRALLQDSRGVANGPLGVAIDIALAVLP